MNILSFPFRLAGDGTVATVDQDSDQAAAEQLALLLLIRRGERPLVPDYGVTDMTGRGLDASQLVAAAVTYGPDVNVVDVTINEVGDGVQQVTVTYE